MPVQHRRNSARGYTLIEMVVVVGIVGLIASIGIPLLVKANENARLRSATRETINIMNLTRTMSVPGGRSPHSPIALPLQPDPNINPNEPNSHTEPPPPMARMNPGSNGGESVVQSEFRIESPTRIEIWTRTDQGNESLARVIDFLANDPNSQVSIVTPQAPARIRFKNGRKEPNSPNQVELVDAVTGKHTFVDVGVAGMRIRN